MRRRILLILSAISVIPCAVGQSSSLNAFSPYTMYGIGDLAIGGTLSSRLMGGIGIAVADPNQFNYQNPASLSAFPRNCALFNLGAAMNNYYSQTGKSKTSFNSIDLHDLGFAIPLYRGIGLGFSLTPLSAVGYKSAIVNNNPSITENIGRAAYTYVGEGGVSQLSMHFGMKVVGGLSLGASLNYYFGSIDRYYDADIYPLLNNESYRALRSTAHMNVSKLGYTLGFQYKIRTGKESTLTIGGVFTPQMFINANKTELSVMSGTTMTTQDTIVNRVQSYAIKIPNKFGGGLYFSTPKIGIGVDYTYQYWGGAFNLPENIHLGSQQEIKAGIQYTPDRASVRSALARWTYKVGGRYAQSYLSRDGIALNDWAMTFGADIPLKMRSYSKASVGFEVGQRGTLQGGQVLDTYFKVFVGISIFGDDMWFVKQKFN